MRTIQITLPDNIAQELEEQAKKEGRSLADFAGEQFAIAYNTAPAAMAGQGAPYTVWENNKPVYVIPSPPAWLAQIVPENPPADGSNGLHRGIGQWPGTETETQILDALERLS